MAGIDRIEFRVHDIVSHGAGVLTERTDVFYLDGGRIIERPVLGTFEVADGKITGWRDYFDVQS